jgi:uncharacterized protein (TIGR03067 family)
MQGPRQFRRRRDRVLHRIRCRPVKIHHDEERGHTVCLSCRLRHFLAFLGTDDLQSLHKFLTNRLVSRQTLAAMKLLRRIITIVGIFTTFFATGGEEPTPKAKAKVAVNQPTAAELQPLQGKWEGGVVGDKAGAKITITITNSSFHFHRDTNFWFETTIALPAGTNPKQLHATIKGCPPSQASSIGSVVGAIFKIEDGKLILVTTGGGAEDTPKSFEATEEKEVTRYELRKAQPQKK